MLFMPMILLLARNRFINHQASGILLCWLASSNWTYLANLKIQNVWIDNPIDLLELSQQKLLYYLYLANKNDNLRVGFNPWVTLLGGVVEIIDYWFWKSDHFLLVIHYNTADVFRTIESFWAILFWLWGQRSSQFRRDKRCQTWDQYRLKHDQNKKSLETAAINLLRTTCWQLLGLQKIKKWNWYHSDPQRHSLSLKRVVLAIVR